MCDFDDDFGDDGFTDEDSLEDEFNDQFMDDTDDLDDDFADGSGTDDPEPGDFTAKDAFFIGSIVGNAYEERRRELLRRTRRDPTSD